MTVSFWGVQIAVPARALSHASKSPACDSRFCGYLTSLRCYALRCPFTAVALAAYSPARVLTARGRGPQVCRSAFGTPSAARFVGTANADLQVRAGS